MSKRLTEEAEKYIEDFISNVEDTDISSLDGERSDTSSTLGGMTRADTFRTPPPISKCPPVEMDGVVLPWLQWETSNDASPLSGKNKEPKSTPKSNLWDAAQVLFGLFLSLKMIKDFGRILLPMPSLSSLTHSNARLVCLYFIAKHT